MRIAFAWAFWVLLVLFTSCSEDKVSEMGIESESWYEENLVRQISVSNGYLTDMTPVGVKAVLMDSLLRFRDTVDLVLQSSRNVFTKEKVCYRYSYIKFLVSFKNTDYPDLPDMVFEQYLDSTESYPAKSINIFGAFAAPIIDSLLKEGDSFAEAKAKSQKRVLDFFNISNFDLDEYSMNYQMDDFLPYLYCRYFISDSVFYHDFLEVSEAIRAGQNGEDYYRMRAADELLKVFPLGEWFHVRGFNRSEAYDFFTGFWESVYGMRLCESLLIGDTLVNLKKDSEFFGRTFVCDWRHEAVGSGNPHWRLMDTLENRFGLCLGGMSDVVMEDSVYYQCDKKGWRKTNDVETIINYHFGACNSEISDSLITYKDSLYVCHGEACLLDGLFNWTCYAWTTDTSLVNAAIEAKEQKESDDGGDEWNEYW